MPVASLLIWPLLPFLVVMAPAFARKLILKKRHAFLVWSGVIAGGLGWLLSGALGGIPWLHWLSSGLSWGAATFYILSYKRWESGRIRDVQGSNQSLEKETVALEEKNKALREEMGKWEREESRAFQVYTLAKSLTESVSWDSLVNRFIYVLQKVTGSSNFLLYLTSMETGQLELKVKNGAWSKLNFPEFPVQKHPRWVPFGQEVLLQMPLWQDNALLGVLWVRWPNVNHPSEADIEHIFEHLIIGFRKAQFFSRMESLSRLDGLTGVLRRQNFLDHMESEWNRAKTFNTTFTFVLVDVDHFKKVNDTYGHPAGDAVLSRMGELLSDGIYETDWVGRYGGEEFGILFSRAEPEGVRRKLERLRSTIEKESFSVGNEILKVTVSMGVAHFPADGATVMALMDSADKALYYAKEHGRNKVVDFNEI